MNLVIYSSFPFNGDNKINYQDAFYESIISTSRFNENISIIFLESISEYIKTILESNNIAKDLQGLEKIVRYRINNIFNVKFRDKSFVDNISDAVTNYSYLTKIMGYGKLYQHFANSWATWNNNFMEPLRDTFWRTSSHKIDHFEKYSLSHYDRTAYNNIDGISSYSYCNDTNSGGICIHKQTLYSRFTA